MKKRPTLSDVAQKAGVGTTTVSRVINGGARVDPRTLARVRRAIESLDYVPSHAARVLKGGRTRTIGLIVPSIADPFFSSCAEAVQAVAHANESLLIVTTTKNDPNAVIAGMESLGRHRTDGLIITPANWNNRSLRNALQQLTIPVVALDRPIPNSPVLSVVADNFAGALAATQHLIEHGRKRIMCFTGEENLYTIRERVRGYRAAIEQAGLQLIVESSIVDYRSARFAIEGLLKRRNPPDAIFALKNITAIYAFEVLQQLKIRIPESIALIGFDDFELAASLQPSVTVVRQPVETIGRTAAEILFKQLSHPVKSHVSPPSVRCRPVVLPTRLVCRSSCGCADDPLEPT